MAFSVTIDDEQEVKIDVNPLTAHGRPARLDSAPVWNVTDGDCTIQPASDGMSCVIISGVPGTSHVTVSAQSGGNVLSDSITLSVNPAPASSLGLTAEASTPKS